MGRGALVSLVSRLKVSRVEMAHQLQHILYTQLYDKRTKNFKILSLLDQLEALTGQRPVLECIRYLPVDSHNRYRYQHVLNFFCWKFPFVFFCRKMDVPLDTSLEPADYLLRRLKA